MPKPHEAPANLDRAAAPDLPAGEQPLPGARLVPLGLVRRDPRQPRKWFNPDTLRDLAASIRQQGLLQPVTVRPDGRGRYLVVLGERRFRAAQAAGLAHLPVLVREIDDETSLAAALIENLQRDDLTDDEQAEAFRALRERGWSTR